MFTGSEDSGRVIDLAHSPDFALGAITVRPSSRMLAQGANREVLEPRVMQVLIALAEANGGVVSRDDLVRRCWEGRAVSEDAINRCIARLRRIAESDGNKNFTIETIPRVGYRLSAAAIATPAEVRASLALPAAEPVPAAGPAREESAAAPPAWTGVVHHALFAAAVVVVAGGAAGVALHLMQPKHWVVENSQPIVATPLIERHPAISPDSTMLAYSAGKDIYSRQLYLMRLSGGDPIRLTDDAYDHVAPNWSRDGSRLVYVAVKPGEPCHIFVLPVPAGLGREVARCLSDERSRADWDLSGEAIYFSDSPAKGMPSRIYRLEIASGNRTEITHPPQDAAGDEEPAVSPDGRRIGFLRARSEVDVNLMAYDIATRSENLLYRGVPGFYPSWAWAENSRDVYVSDLRNSTLRRHDLDGGDESLFTSPLMIGRMSRSANGLLAAEMDTYRSNVVVAPEKAGDPPQFIDPANNETSGLTFAPDGTLGMISNRSGDYAIWLMRPGKPASQLVSFGQLKLMTLAFSPDGKRIAAALLIRGGTELRILSAGGTETARIPIASPEIGYLQWLPDGSGLVFPIRDATGFRIVRLDLKAPDKVTPLSDYGWVAVRLHGRDMYGVRPDRPGIWRIADKPVLVVHGFSPTRFWQWGIVGDELVWPDASDRSHLRLRAKPLSGGPDRIFAETPGFGDDTAAGESGEFAVNPQNGQLVYTSAVQADSDIYLLRLTRQ